jgi:hypothetical protein
MAASVKPSAKLRGLLLVLVGFGLVALAGGAGFAAAAAPRSATEPTAIGRNGQVLPSHPVLLRAQQILVRAEGFAPTASVAVRLAYSSSTSYASADGRGIVMVHYTVDPALAYGPYVLTLVGAPGSSASSTPQEGDDSPFLFLVPRVWLFQFRVAASTGTVRPPPGGSGVGGVAYTGVDIAALLALAAIVLVLGGVVLRTARRR